MPRIFRIRESLDDDRPTGANFRDEMPLDGSEWPLPYHEILMGLEPPPEEEWEYPPLVSSSRGATPIEEWDYYMSGGGASFGLFSPRTNDLFEPFLHDRFAPIPVDLEGHLYYTYLCRKRIDCLDRERSDISYYEHPEGTLNILTIDKYAMYGDEIQDSMIFAIPDRYSAIFCTETVVHVAEENNLKGFDFEECLVTSRK